MRRAVDYVAETVGVLLMTAVAVTFTAPLWIADAIRGRRHAGAKLDSAHIDENGDRLPIGDDETIRLLVRREWR